MDVLYCNRFRSQTALSINLKRILQSYVKLMSQRQAQLVKRQELDSRTRLLEECNDKEKEFFTRSLSIGLALHHNIDRCGLALKYQILDFKSLKFAVRIQCNGELLYPS